MQYSKIDLEFHAFHCNCIITPFYTAKTCLWSFSCVLNSTEAFKIGQKFLVWAKQVSPHEKLNSRSPGFNSRAFYAHVRLVFNKFCLFCQEPLAFWAATVNSKMMKRRKNLPEYRKKMGLGQRMILRKVPMNTKVTKIVTN